MWMHPQKESLGEFLVSADTAMGASGTRHAWVKEVHTSYALTESIFHCTEPMESMLLDLEDWTESFSLSLEPSQTKSAPNSEF